MQIITQLTLLYSILIPSIIFAQNDSLIINQIKATYQKCNTYEDKIDVVTSITTNDGVQEKEQTFETIFKRSGFFRLAYFQFSEHQTLRRREVVYKSEEGEKAVYWRLWGDTKEMPLMEGNLDKMLSYSAGSNSGISTLIPRLLLPKNIEKNGYWKEMYNYERLEDESINGVYCYQFKQVITSIRSEEENEKVKGMFGRELAKRVDREIIYWFSQATNLLLKVEMNSQFDDRMTTKMVIDYQPKINMEIPKKKLQPNFPSNF